MPGNLPNFIQGLSAEELATTLAEKIASSLSKSIGQKGQASLVVSGGSTPRLLFEKLSRQPIDWQQITITLADERWVDTTATESNEFLVKSLLLKQHASAAKFVGLKNEAKSTSLGEEATHLLLNTVPRPFDLVILGMGDDGHTASLFPGAERLGEAVDMNNENNCIGITSPNAPFDRMSMTLRTLLDSTEIILHITGASKKSTLEKALEDGEPEDMPIRYILKQEKTPVHIYWAP